MSKYYCPCCFGHHEECNENCEEFLSLPSLDGIVVEVLCDHIVNGTDLPMDICPRCNGTGTIIRQATKDEIEEAMDIAKEKKLEFHLKSGGKLRIREKD